ncbi:hypothetical protein B0H11DRAFT_1975682 [Mycena galericulata]|nr:hypothetical protein B0H11DRAFT_1975682 [Mycena galericulata]
MPDLGNYPPSSPSPQGPLLCPVFTAASDATPVQRPRPPIPTSLSGGSIQLQKAEIPALSPVLRTHTTGHGGFLDKIENVFGREFTRLLLEFGITEDDDLRLMLQMHKSRNIRLTDMFDDNKIPRTDQKQFWAKLSEIEGFPRPPVSTCPNSSCVKLGQESDLGAHPCFYFLKKRLGLENPT